MLKTEVCVTASITHLQQIYVAAWEWENFSGSSDTIVVSQSPHSVGSYDRITLPVTLYTISILVSMTGISAESKALKLNTQFPLHQPHEQCTYVRCCSFQVQHTLL